MQNELTTQSENFSVIVSTAKSKDHRHRLIRYANWLTSTGRSWHSPDLETYRDYLLNDYETTDGSLLSESSVKAHLSTIRGRYQAILRDNRTRDALYAITPDDAPASDRKAFVDEIVQRIQNAIAPENSSVKVVTRQDQPDEEHLRLTIAQAETLMNAPGRTSLIGLRDTAMICLMLGTGIREAELCGLDCVDLHRKLGGETALHIRRGKGRKERLVPYGQLIWVLDVVELWLRNAGISSGAVFRGFYKGGKTIRDKRINVRSVNKILENYPIFIDGNLRKVRPHDLRRTYARRLYEAGVDLLAIRDNLGHADSRTTLKYIGTMDAEARKPPSLFRSILK